MSQLVDNLIAYRILTMLVKPFEETSAYKLGIIDAKGNNLKKSSTFHSSDEREAYTYLHRLVFNMKKIINRLPGGESRLKSLVAALFLVKEYYVSKDKTTSLMESRYLSILEKVEEGVILVEEEIAVKRFVIAEEGEGGIANVTGAAVSTNEPKIDKKNIKKYQTMTRRSKPVEFKENSSLDRFKKYTRPVVKTTPKIERDTNPSGRTNDHVEWKVTTHTGEVHRHKTKKEAQAHFDSLPK
jgi:hypothetical protein